jgi:hypothetical protein
MILSANAYRSSPAMAQQCPSRGAVTSVFAATLATTGGELVSGLWDDAPIGAIEVWRVGLMGNLRLGQRAPQSGAKDA